MSHTKDDILWLGDEQEQVEDALHEHCEDFRQRALQHRSREDVSRVPSEAEVDLAVDELKRELDSKELVDRVQLEEVPPPEVAEERFRSIRESAQHRQETFGVRLDDVVIRGFLAHDLSVNDPYVTVDAAKENEVTVTINMQHPHIHYLEDSVGLLNYFRHCTSTSRSARTRS